MEKGSGMRETKMIYKFDYLPAGLFNRGQVGSVPSFTDLDMGDYIADLDDDALEWLHQLQ